MEQRPRLSSTPERRFTLPRELRTVGFFRETHPFLIRGRCHSLPSFYECLAASRPEDQNKLISYLRCGKEHDYLSSRPILQKPEDRLLLTQSGLVLTDGIWVWPSELAYYVEVYNLQLPEEFISDIRSRDWVVPADVDCDSLVFPGSV